MFGDWSSGRSVPVVSGRRADQWAAGQEASQRPISDPLPFRPRPWRAAVARRHGSNGCACADSTCVGLIATGARRETAAAAADHQGQRVSVQSAASRPAAAFQSVSNTAATQSCQRPPLGVVSGSTLLVIALIRSRTAADRQSLAQWSDCSLLSRSAALPHFPRRSAPLQCAPPHCMSQPHRCPLSVAAGMREATRDRPLRSRGAAAV